MDFLKAYTILLYHTRDRASIFFREKMQENIIYSPVIGKIVPTALSGGVKTLILMKNDRSRIFNASTCGDNCAKWILKLSEMDDLTITGLYV